jgi:hypothetical protein
MGYYVNTEDINIIVPKDLLEPAYKAVLAMNEDDQLKRGGSYGPGDSREFWFSWMPKDLSTLDNPYYKWEFTDGKMLVIPGEVEITWFPDNAYSAVDAWNDSQEMMAAFRSTLDAKKALDAEKVEDANA